MNYAQICSARDAEYRKLNNLADDKNDSAHLFEANPALKAKFDDAIMESRAKASSLCTMKREMSAKLSNRNDEQYWRIIPSVPQWGRDDIPERYECQNCFRTSFANTEKPCECHESHQSSEPWDSDMAASINQ